MFDHELHDKRTSPIVKFPFFLIWARCRIRQINLLGRWQLQCQAPAKLGWPVMILIKIWISNEEEKKLLVMRCACSGTNWTNNQNTAFLWVDRFTWKRYPSVYFLWVLWLKSGTEGFIASCYIYRVLISPLKKK